MTTHDHIAYTFAEYAGGPDAHLMCRARSGHSLYVSTHDPRNLLSWGEHFTLARIMLDEHGQRSWWLINGDRWGISTSRHQTITREHCQRTGLPCLIVPFSSLEEAGIQLDSITPLDVQKERHDEIAHYAEHREDVPDTQSPVQLPDGRWTWATYRHWLGAALFSATYQVRRWSGNRGRDGHAWFLSAFDEQESRPHYFLCQLPYDGEPGPTTVEQAFEWLKPHEVHDAEAAGAVCTRQGDLFAVPTTLTTRQVAAFGERRRRRLVTVGALTWDADPTRVEVSHAPTEVVHGDDGTVYARGCLYHRPSGWRAPEHKRQRMGDGRTWHQLVKNTVPVDDQGGNRAWSLGGNVD